MPRSPLIQKWAIACKFAEGVSFETYRRKIRQARVNHHEWTIGPTSKN